MIPALAWMLAWVMFGPSKEVDAAVRRAEAHFLAEEYDRASEAFADAYALDPDPNYLYARAQAMRLHGDCGAAIELYERFLATDPPDPASTEAVVNRDRCKTIVDARRAPPAAPEPTTATSDEPPPTSTSTVRDPLGFALLGTGGAAVAIGAGVWGIAIANDREAPESRSEDEFVESKDKARLRHRAGIAVTSIGTALVIAGAVRLLIVAKRRPRRTTATLAVDPTGAGLVFTGRF